MIRALADLAGRSLIWFALWGIGIAALSGI
jgi:hypothetical protein